MAKNWTEYKEEKKPVNIDYEFIDDVYQHEGYRKTSPHHVKFYFSRYEKELEINLKVWKGLKEELNWIEEFIEKDSKYLEMVKEILTEIG